MSTFQKPTKKSAEIPASLKIFELGLKVFSIQSLEAGPKAIRKIPTPSRLDRDQCAPLQTRHADCSLGARELRRSPTSPFTGINQMTSIKERPYQVYFPASKPLPKSPKPEASQPSLRPTQEARRQFSFTNVFPRNSRALDPNSDLFSHLCELALAHARTVYRANNEGQ
jgi:hypothetical protein